MPVKVGRVAASENLKETIGQVVDQVGGLGVFVRAGDRVLIKPNFNTADPFPASSDFGFLAAVVDLCHEQGAAEVAIGESSTYFLNTSEVMREWGIDRLRASRPWLNVINFDDGKWVKRQVTDGKFLKHASLPEALDQYERLILVPCLKTHKWAAYTGALKLAVGLMKPSERMALHARHIQEKIAELNSLFKPDLVIMDGRSCFINYGPSSGPVRKPNVVMASTGRVAIDREGIGIIAEYPESSLAGHQPEDITQVQRAIELGID
jgi:uncharacterized protein (DUF362 family)